MLNGLFWYVTTFTFFYFFYLFFPFFQLKIKDNGELGNYENYVISYVEEDVCPSFSPSNDSIVISQSYERDSSSLYAYQYNISHTSLSNGSHWIMFIESLIPNSQMHYDDNPIPYSLQVFQDFICIPACLNGGTCSKKFPNTCDCTAAGYMGDRCELRKFL